MDYQIMIPGFLREWITDEQLDDREHLKIWLDWHVGARDFLREHCPGRNFADAIREIADAQNTLPGEPKPITDKQKNGNWYLVGDGEDYSLGCWQDGAWGRFEGTMKHSPVGNYSGLVTTDASDYRFVPFQNQKRIKFYLIGAVSSHLR